MTKERVVVKERNAFEGKSDCQRKERRAKHLFL
jgi:hypothetical protein